MRGAQRLVEQHFLGTIGLCHHANFVGLATANKQGRIRHLALAGKACHGVKPCGLREQTQLFQLGIEVRKTKIHPDQHDRGGFLVVIYLVITQ
ncbi:hypothetical protein D3C71_1949510 [compost metagenome]